MFVPIFSEIGENHRLKQEELMELWTEYLARVDRGKAMKNCTIFLITCLSIAHPSHRVIF